MKFNRKTALRLEIAALPMVLAATASTSAYAAQPAKAEGAKPADAAAEEDGTSIVVTGSRIKQPNLQSANPISVLTGEQVFERGEISLGDQLNDLPQLRNTYSQQNSTRFLGTRGINLLDLRGLGTSRTLVLVNGRRHVGGDILVNGVSPDINTIPTDLIERTDIVTGGASAVYGSDAIAGVVNFILKDHYDGVQVRGQSGVSTYGDAGSQYISVLAGKNFADGRGNIAMNFEFSHSSAYYASDRPDFSHQDAFVITETDAAGSTNGAAGGFDRTFYKDIRSATISTGGMVAIRYPNAASQPCGNDYLGNSYTCAFLFQPNGGLTQETGTRVGLGPNGNFIGGNGYSGREGQLLTFQPDLKRYVVNLIGHFEISPAFVPFFEAKYARTEALGSVSGPFFSQGQTLGDGITVAGLNDKSYASTTSAANGAVNREGIRLDNPYLTAQSRALLAAQMTAAVNAGVNPNTGTAFTTAAQSVINKNLLLSQITDGSARFSLRRNWVDLGIRDEDIKRQTYRIVAGVRGDFNDSWSYELSFNYGQHKETNIIKGNVNRQRYLLAVDSVRKSDGTIACRSQVDGSYAGTDRAGNASVLAADIAACVPINPFGDGSVSDAAKKYLLVDSMATGKITQLDILGYVAGDTSKFLNLPGGPVGFSVGGEYRRETNDYTLDALTQAGYAFYNAIPTFASTSFEVKEAFGEIRLPLLKDMALFQELTLKGNGRIANYKGKTGTVYAYGGEILWKPISDITLRGTYARSVRAPNLQELYSAQGQNFAPGFTDPCSDRNLAAGTTYRVANCNAAGKPTGYDYVYSSSLEIVSGGNPNLSAEKSDSWTLGVLLQPRFIPGFSISADWYDITVNNVIASIGSAQTIVNLCYDSATLSNPYCALFSRAGSAGGPRGEIPFRILEGSLLQAAANFARTKVRGIDVQANYRHDFGFAEADMSAIYTHQIKNESYTNPSDPTFVNVFVGELGDPDDQVNFNLNLKRGKVTFGYQARWISGQYLNTYEDYNSTNGQPPQNADYAPIRKYPDVMYHSVRLGVDVNEKFNIYLGCENLFDKQPPYGLTGVGGGSGIYDVRGRYMYVGFKAKM